MGFIVIHAQTIGTVRHEVFNKLLQVYNSAFTMFTTVKVRKSAICSENCNSKCCQVFGAIINAAKFT